MIALQAVAFTSIGFVIGSALRFSLRRAFSALVDKSAARDRIAKSNRFEISKP